MRFIHVGHSPIFKDSRILKYAKSLISHGYDVSLIGLDDKRHAYSMDADPAIGKKSFKPLDIHGIRKGFAQKFKNLIKNSY
ncbi:hypothetical protein OAE17_04435 [Gammaproteobacteria bacterium]|nr:hypothetical protein [Gammaproteobacteria bacterium]